MITFDPSRFKPPELFTTLAVDALYFVAANDALKRAKQTTKRIERAAHRVASLQSKIDDLSLNEDGERDSQLAMRNYDRLEQLSIWIEGAEYQLGEAYGPMLQDVAAVHILSAASLEAHINIQAQARLEGHSWTSFERLSLEAKWLFFPKLVGAAGFDLGIEPFQGFYRLIRLRNRLAHYRLHHEPWASPGVPGFLETLGLTIEAAELSLQAVRAMISELAVQMKEDRPYWLDGQQMNFFRIELERKDDKAKQF